MIKRKDLEMLYDERCKRNEALEEQVAQLTTALDNFRTREASIAGALTAAMEKQKQIVAQAEHDLRVAQQQGRDVVEIASAEAEKLIEEARRKSQSMMDTARNKIKFMQSEFDAYEKNGKHAYALVGTELADISIRLLEFVRTVQPDFDESHIEARLNAAKNGEVNVPAVFPEEYKTPAELYHSIMHIGGSEAASELMRATDHVEITDDLKNRTIHKSPIQQSPNNEPMPEFVLFDRPLVENTDENIASVLALRDITGESSECPDTACAISQTTTAASKCEKTQKASEPNKNVSDEALIAAVCSLLGDDVDDNLIESISGGNRAKDTCAASVIEEDDLIRVSDLLKK